MWLVGYRKHMAVEQVKKIFHGCEVWIEKSARGSLFGISRLCRVMPNGDPEGSIFLSAPKNMTDSFSGTRFDLQRLILT